MLFKALKIRDITFKNRIVVSPMCQYSSLDGYANDWHLVHLGSRAVGGAGLVFTEAAAIEAKGRISPQDLGIWRDDHIIFLSRIVSFIESQGSVAGIQLAHAGRKASTSNPWEGDKPIDTARGGWSPIVAPSPIAFDQGYRLPHELSVQEIHDIKELFVAAAKRSLKAGFKVIEIHSAHGYLLHEFLSPASNKRNDAYGGSFDNRIRLLLETVIAVRAVMPQTHPLFVRISATDWLERGGWDLDQSVWLAKFLKEKGVALIDCSSGGLLPHIKIPAAPGFQLPFSKRIRAEAGILTGGVGLITSPGQANDVLISGDADMVFIARQFLRDPYWAAHAQGELQGKADLPNQYKRI